MFYCKDEKNLGKFSKRRSSLLSILMFLSCVHNRKLPSREMKIRQQWDSNSKSLDSKSDALSVRLCGRSKVVRMWRFIVLKKPLFTAQISNFF